MLVVGGYAARYADKAVDRGAASGGRPAGEQRVVPQPTSSGRSTDARQRPRRSFPASTPASTAADIDFMVDTGASVVDPARDPTPPMLGICIRCRATTRATVSTANGRIKAAPAKLDAHRDRRHHRVRRAGAGAAGRGAVDETCSASSFLSELQALRIRQRADGARAISFRRSANLRGPLCAAPALELLTGAPAPSSEDSDVSQAEIRADAQYLRL